MESYYGEKAPAVEPVLLSERNKISSKTINAKDEYSFAVASLTISHNVIRRHLSSIIGKAPTVAPANQAAFLKYASFAAWHIKAYLKSSHHLYAALHECTNILPCVSEFEHQLAIAPLDGNDIALAAERLADVLLPHLDRREAAMQAYARSMPVRMFREAQKEMQREIKGSKVGNSYALAMIAAHQSKAEAALFPSSMSKMVGGIVYGKYGLFGCTAS
ncbi:hypothetical protein BDZ89DRAFT_1035757 [Hymenopellis radicata]|nr:hypothetical protein BDZ89DRAFT_1035757 [Hymenopellis radicata]